eukprot:2696684-Amphidinium_carterae.1
MPQSGKMLKLCTLLYPQEEKNLESGFIIPGFFPLDTHLEQILATLETGSCKLAGGLPLTCICGYIGGLLEVRKGSGRLSCAAGSTGSAGSS